MNNLRQCKLRYYFTVDEEGVDKAGAFGYFGAVPPNIVVERRLLDGKIKNGVLAGPMTHVVLTAGRQFADRLVRGKSDLPHLRGSRPLRYRPHYPGPDPGHDRGRHRRGDPRAWGSRLVPANQHSCPWGPLQDR